MHCAILLATVALVSCNDATRNKENAVDANAQGDSSPVSDAPRAAVDARHAVDAPLAAVDTPLAAVDAPLAAIDAPLATVDAPSPVDAMCAPPRVPTSDEALFELDRIASAAKAYFLANGNFPPTTAAELPSTTACASGGFNPVHTTQWEGDPGWVTLHFEIGIPNRFNYRYTSVGSNGAQALAVGDLDCDGISISYTLDLSVQGNAPTATITSPPAGAD